MRRHLDASTCYWLFPYCLISYLLTLTNTDKDLTVNRDTMRRHRKHSCTWHAYSDLVWAEEIKGLVYAEAVWKIKGDLAKCADIAWMVLSRRATKYKGHRDIASQNPDS